MCPVCGNIIRTTGDAVISCCGITLPPLEAEETDDDHIVTIEPVEDEKIIAVAGNYVQFSNNILHIYAFEAERVNLTINVSRE